MSAMYVQDITNRTNQAASVSLSASHTKTSITPFQKVLRKMHCMLRLLRKTQKVRR